MKNIYSIEEIKLTELYCQDLFEQCLSHNIYSALPTFDNVLREIPCKQGVADFICFNNTTFLTKNSEQIYRITEKLGKTFIPVVVSLLNSQVQNEHDITNATGYDLKKVKKILNYLVEEKVVKKHKDSRYSLYQNWKKLDVELWAFELKLKNWKRALYQSMQYKTFTNNVFAVFPVDKRDLILKNINSFKRLKVGCIIQDHENNQIEMIYKPENLAVNCNSQYLFALTETIIMKKAVNSN